jgi:hypothetical protein
VSDYQLDNDTVSTGVRIEETTFRGYWDSHTAAGVLALGAVVFLVLVHRSFRNHLGG